MVERLWNDSALGWRLARAALLPFSLAFRGITAARNLLYDHRVISVRRADVSVVSVGNLRVGGTGKTPFVIWLVERLRARGLRPLVVARGYGASATATIAGTAADLEHVARDVSACRRVIDADVPFANGCEIADEALLVAMRTRVPVVTSADRYAACALACECFAPDVIVLDDAFQHRRLARDCDIVLLASGDRDARLLPAGPLRETVAGLKRADIVLATDAALGEPKLAQRAVGWVSRPDAEASVDPIGLLCGAPVVAVAGIARNDAFFAMLCDAGLAVKAAIGFRDHHRYRRSDWLDITAVAHGVRWIVTTEKDLVKLAEFARGDVRLRALRIDVEVEGADAIVDSVCARARLDARRRGQHDRARPRGTEA